MTGYPKITYSAELEDILTKFSQHAIPLETPGLTVVVEQIAITGLICYPWAILSPLLASMLVRVLEGLHHETPSENFEEQKSKLLETFSAFHDPPFTIQRLCELVTRPECWGYRTAKKYIFAIDKVLNVTSSERILSPEEYDRLVEVQFENMRLVKSSSFANSETEGSEDEDYIMEQPLKEDSISPYPLGAFNPIIVRPPSVDREGVFEGFLKDQEER